MAKTPNKGYTLLQDGEIANSTTLVNDLQRIDATLNLILEDVYETNTGTIDTPTDAQPGQAWFIGDSVPLSGAWLEAYGTNTSRSEPLIAIAVRQEGSEPGLSTGNDTWVSSPVKDTAYGYILSRNGRYQFNPNTGLWEGQSKIQETSWKKSTPSGVTVSAGSDLHFPVMTTPFAITISDIQLQLLTDAVSPEGILPRIAYSTDPTSDFSTWTTLVKEGYREAGGGNWGTAASLALTVQEANQGSAPADGPSGALPGTPAPWINAVIPGGATIGLGGPWSNASSQTATTDPTTVREIGLQILYIEP